MFTKSFAEISRRSFLAVGSISVPAAWLHPRELFAGQVTTSSNLL
jgi:hypothetical protein